MLGWYPLDVLINGQFSEGRTAPSRPAFEDTGGGRLRLRPRGRVHDGPRRNCSVVGSAILQQSSVHRSRRTCTTFAVQGQDGYADDRRAAGSTRTARGARTCRREGLERIRWTSGHSRSPGSTRSTRPLGCGRSYGARRRDGTYGVRRRLGRWRTRCAWATRASGHTGISRSTGSNGTVRHRRQ